MRSYTDQEASILLSYYGPLLTNPERAKQSTFVFCKTPVGDYLFQVHVFSSKDEAGVFKTLSEVAAEFELPLPEEVLSSKL